MDIEKLREDKANSGSYEGRFDNDEDTWNEKIIWRFKKGMVTLRVWIVLMIIFMAFATIAGLEGAGSETAGALTLMLSMISFILFLTIYFGTYALEIIINKNVYKIEKENIEDKQYKK